MERIVLTEMESLLSPVEQAELIGMIKEPEQLSLEVENNHRLKGAKIGALITAAVFVVIIGFAYYLSEQDKKEES